MTTANPKISLELHQFMRSTFSAENAALQLSKLVEKDGDESCVFAACEALNAGFLGLLAHAHAQGFDRKVNYESANGEKKTGSLIDYSIAVARSRGTECPEGVIKLLHSKGVEAAADCDHPTIVRYRTEISPSSQPSFAQAAARFDVVGMFSSAARFAARNIEAFTPPTSAPTRKLDTI